MPSNSTVAYQAIDATRLNFQGTFLHSANPYQELSVVLHFRSKTTVQSQSGDQHKEMETIYTHPLKRTYLTHEDLTGIYGATEEDIQKITDYFKQFNLKVTNSNRLARTAVVKGNIAEINLAFKTKVGVYQGPNKFVFLAYKGALELPTDLAAIITGVTGLTTLLKSEFRIPSEAEDDPDGLESAKVKGFTAKQLMTAYNYPEDLNGKGETIGIIELGGQYKKSDIKQYFKMMKIPVPKIIEVGTPISDSNMLNNSEITLDLQVAGTVAPGATLVVYYGNTIAEALKLIIQDTKNKPSVVSISWAGSEYNYSPAQISELNELFYQAAMLGITVVAASGDHGALNSRQFPNVSIPSSNPMVIGCGGTTVSLTPEDAIESEVVWNQENGQIGSGGGFSKVFPLPTYQKGAVGNYPYFHGSTRGVPDIAANADGVNGYIVIFNGVKMPIGGTSAATPLIAGLFALMNQSFGRRLGYVNTWLYEFAGTKGFSQITEGNNGYYQAATYWNPATGLGSPNGKELLDLFKAGQ